MKALVIQRQLSYLIPFQSECQESYMIWNPKSCRILLSSSNWYSYALIQSIFVSGKPILHLEWKQKKEPPNKFPYLGGSLLGIFESFWLRPNKSQTRRRRNTYETGFQLPYILGICEIKSRSVFALFCSASSSCAVRLYLIVPSTPCWLMTDGRLRATP